MQLVQSAEHANSWLNSVPYVGVTPRLNEDGSSEARVACMYKRFLITGQKKMTVG